MKSKKFTIALLVLLIACLSSFAGGVFAYFSAVSSQSAGVSMEVNQLFGRLDSGTGTWGTESNPYLINESRHLYNLYNIQNIETGMFDESTVFLVAKSDGTPACVQPEDGKPINSIGSEDYPFISTIKGVVDTANPVTLPSGEKSNVSCIYGFEVSAYNGQIDVGLFGNVGNHGCIQDLLLYDISITSKSTGGNKKDHPNYQVKTDHETNHIGILAGHAENCTIKNISVYYSADDIAAFNVTTDSAAYTSAGGILGYYQGVTVIEGEPPVSSESNFDGGFGGGNTVGSGTGFMFSGDVMSLVSGNPDTCDLQLIDDLYKDAKGNIVSKDYFVQGVFTFAHSGAYVAGSDNNDKIVKLWNIAYTEENLANGTNDDTSDDWYYTDGEYNEGKYGNNYESYEYELIPASTDANGNSTTLNDIISACTNNARIMCVYSYNEKDYVMTWDGTALVPQPFEIITGETSYVLDEYGNPTYDENGNPITTKEADRIGIPYTSGGNSNLYNYSVIFNNGGKISFGDGTGNSFLSVSTSWGSVTGISLTGGGKQFGIDLQNRIFFSGTISGYYMKQSGSNSISISAFPDSSCISFTFYQIKLSTKAKKELKRVIYTPADGGVKVDLSQNVLFYDGKVDNGGGAYSYNYTYKLTTLSELNWLHTVKVGGVNTLQPLTSIDTALVMARAVNFRKATFFGSWDLNENGLVAVPLGDSSNVKVPKGSVAFQVQGTGITGDTAKINVIVATNPMLGIDQEIGCYKMESGGILSYNDPENNLGGRKFLLPKVPGENSATPISLKVGENTYTAYTNMQTVLVAYTFTIDCESDTVYYLAANSGAASFVYFSVDSVAADGTRNTEHENDLYFPPLNGVDYVYKNTVDSVTTIITVDNGSYVHSLIMPYVGMYPSPESADPKNPVIAISNVAKLEFKVRRRWALSTTTNTTKTGTDMTADELTAYGIYSGEYGVLVFTNCTVNGDLVTEDTAENFSTLLNYTDGHYVNDSKQNEYSDKVIFYPKTAS